MDVPSLWYGLIVNLKMHETTILICMLIGQAVLAAEKSRVMAK